MIVVGLTGGIGSGKTETARTFAKLGVPVINADKLAREVVSPGHDAYKEMIRKLGEDILTAEKTIDRDKLRGIIFTDPAIKEWLEDLLHPKICEKIRWHLTQIDAPYVIVEIPLLQESKQKLPLDQILVLACPQHIRIKRVQQRSKLSEAEIKRIIQTQASEEQLISNADEIIYNDQDLQHLYQQIKSLHKKYLQLGTKK